MMKKNPDQQLFFYGENLNRFPPYNNDKLLYETFDLIVGFKYNDLSKKQIRQLRKNADIILLDGMNNAEPDVPVWKIKACYGVVRLLGGVCIRNRSYRERHGW